MCILHFDNTDFIQIYGANTKIWYRFMSEQDITKSTGKNFGKFGSMSRDQMKYLST